MSPTEHWMPSTPGEGKWPPWTVVALPAEPTVTVGDTLCRLALCSLP
jgi:hypothetical protein